MDDKHQYVTEVEQQLRRWDDRITQIQRQAERKQVDTPAIERLLQLRERAQGSFEILRNAGADEWQTYQADMAQSTSELKDALERLEPRVSGKRSPGTTTPQRALSERIRAHRERGRPRSSARHKSIP